MKFLTYSLIALTSAHAALAMEPTPYVAVKSQYQDAATGEKVKKSTVANFWQPNPTMEKTVLVVKTSEQISQSLSAWSKTCDDLDTKKIAVSPENKDEPAYERSESQYSQKCKAEKLNVVGALNAMIANATLNSAAVNDRKFSALIETLHKLSASMEKKANEKMSGWGGCHDYRCYERSYSPMPSAPMSESADGGNMNVTTGGAQDAQRFRDLVDAGQIPEPTDYQAYGLINEFDLSLPGQTCAELLCVTPVVTIDQAAKKLYVRTSIATNVKVDSFVRRPINLAITMDVSGSMDANDNTKQSRLEWAKEAVRKTLEKLVDGQDYFTLSYFSDDAKVLWPVSPEAQPKPITKADKIAILDIVRRQQTIGSTNLRAGLDLAYRELNDAKKKLEAANKADGFEHRVILLTDANLNYGDTDESSAVIAVENQSRDNGINLTTIGIGQNFFAKFIDRVSILRGSNYIFAQDGQRMLEYFEQFDTLVTPVAYDFTARVDIQGVDAKLVRIHGVPELSAAPASDNLVSIRTLFFAAPKSKGGGAQVLEYDLL
jgi:hypothetical protein